MAGREALKFKVTVPPATEPVMLADIKAQLRVDVSDTTYDEQLAPLIVPAREWCEKYQNRAYITQTIELVKDDFSYGDEIRLPHPPLQTVSSLTVTNAAGSVSTVSSSAYIVDSYSEPGFLVASPDWPRITLQAANAIKVTYIAGYGTASEMVPATIRQAIILLVIHWFNNGLCDPPAAVYALLDLERVIPV